MSRSLDQLRRVSAKLVEGEGETFDSEFLRDGVEFFGITTGRYQCGLGAQAKVYKAGRKQFLQSPLGRFRAFLAGALPPSLSSSRPPEEASVWAWLRGDV